MTLRVLGDEKENKTENMAEIMVFLCGGGGGSKYHQNNVNPFEICNNWIQLNMVFYVMIIF